MNFKASMELFEFNRFTNYSYRNWNRSAYLYNKDKKRYELKEELGRSYDVPKYVKVNL